ncbi:hypothetical protein [Actinoallomurus acaciae]|uniref:Uncharacterized protein n=1 Tax=Actinoallomurus acaciae TaxID=502577 RepID=A0ABV5YL44_9ACTN
MGNESVVPDAADDGDAWAGTRGMVHYSVAVPDEKAARSVARVLGDRGHRWVTVVPLHRLRRLPKTDQLIRRESEFAGPELAGWWHVGSMVDEQAPARAPLVHAKGLPQGYEHIIEALDRESEPEPDAYAEGLQQEYERVAVEALAREHGGFAGSGWSSLRAGTLRGPAPQRPAPELFDLGGLVHELDQEQAHAVRRSVIAGFPAEPERPLRAEHLACEDEERDYPPLLACVQEVAGRLRAGQGPPVPVQKPWEAALTGGIIAAWLAAEADDFQDDQDVSFWLDESVMRQGVCFPHTAHGVPLLAGLAGHDEVHPARRAASIASLFEAASVGRRAAASEADRRSALGLPMSETADERSARLAAEAAAPGLLGRWDRECEALRFALAALAAACPAAAASTGSIDRVRSLTARWSDGPRGDALRLALALAEDEPRGLSAALNAYLERGHRRPGDVPSPHAPARGAALELLKRDVRRELHPLLIL